MLTPRLRPVLSAILGLLVLFVTSGTGDAVAAARAVLAAASPVPALDTGTLSTPAVRLDGPSTDGDRINGLVAERIAGQAPTIRLLPQPDRPFDGALPPPVWSPAPVLSAAAEPTMPDAVRPAGGCPGIAAPRGPPVGA